MFLQFWGIRERFPRGGYIVLPIVGGLLFGLIGILSPLTLSDGSLQSKAVKKYL